LLRFNRIRGPKPVDKLCKTHASAVNKLCKTGARAVNKLWITGHKILIQGAHFPSGTGPPDPEEGAHPHSIKLLKYMDKCRLQQIAAINLDGSVTAH
jgi:hypothetical protein